MKPAIVYLAQNSPKDPQYGRNSRSLLEKSLDLLYKNYNAQFGHDVLIFHEGDFTAEDQRCVAKDRKEIRFVEIHFELPPFLNPEEVPLVWKGTFGMGFRHMCRFYSLLVFDLLEEMGYDWFFRMDDDSFLHSKIRYNLFEFMAGNGYDYGYRVDVKEPENSSRGFGEAVQAYLRAEEITPALLYRNFDLRWFPEALITGARDCVKKALMWLDKNRSYCLTFPGLSLRGAILQYNRHGYYNNFLITPLRFWKSAPVQSFLLHMDRVGAGYKYRWSDLLIQSAAVQIFMPKEKIHKFTDWTYEHATIRNGRLDFGGIYEGLEDKGSMAVKRFVELYGKAHVKVTW